MLPAYRPDPGRQRKRRVMDTPQARTPLILPCPYCGAELHIEEADWRDGAGVHCAHCNNDAVLQCEWIGHGSHPRWELVEDGDADEP